MKQLSYTLEDESGKTFLRSYIYHVGSFHYNWHKEIELLCVLSGSIEVCAEGRVYSLTDDDLLLINANVGHATLSRAVDSTILLVRINPSFLKKVCPDLERKVLLLSSQNQEKYNASFSEIRKCMARMMLARCGDEDPLAEFAFNSAMYTLVWRLLHDFPPQQRQSVAMFSEKEDEENIHNIIQFLESHYREKITLQDIAEKWNYASAYASQIFREYVGISFYDYLTRIRLRQATRELTETDHKILDIAADNGFQNLKSFNAKFREIFGRSPSDYRNSLQDMHVHYDATFKKVFINADNAQVMSKLKEYAEMASLPAREPEAGPGIPERKREELQTAGEDIQRLAGELLKISEKLRAES